MNLKKINKICHEYMVWNEDEKTHGVMEKWKSWWPELKLIREGRGEEVASSIPQNQYVRAGRSIKLYEDCDGWACTSVEAAMENRIAAPEHIGIALVLDTYGQSKGRGGANHAIAVFSLNEGKDWVTIDSQSRGNMLPLTYMGHDYKYTMFMDKPGEWSKDLSKLGK